MSRKQQVYQRDFDADFLRLPPDLRERLQDALDAMGKDLRTYPHHRLTGVQAFRMRVGDYRVIYDFDAAKNEIQLLAVGHRREIYRG